MCVIVKTIYLVLPIIWNQYQTKLFFFYMENISAWKHSLEKFSLYYCISSETSFSAAGYLKRSCVKSVHIRSYSGPYFSAFVLGIRTIYSSEYGHFLRNFNLVDVVLRSKTLSSRLGILTLALIAMSYFFRCQKSNFNLENNKRV